jgi:hypothetical protein
MNKVVNFDYEKMLQNHGEYIIRLTSHHTWENRIRLKRRIQISDRELRQVGYKSFKHLLECV